MDEIRTTGKTVDDALTEALIQLGTTSDKVEYEVIEKGSAGFFGIGSKKAEIVVRRKKEQPEKEEQKAAEQKVEEVKPEIKETPEVKPQTKAPVKKTETKKEASEKPVKKENKENKPVKKEEAVKEETVKEEAPAEEKVVTPLDTEKVKETVDAFLKNVFDTMQMTVEVKYQFDAANRMVSIELVGSDMGILIGKRGQTLDSLQYLISLVVNKDEKEFIRVKLDTENYRRRRRATLENLAKNIAYKVKRERKPIALEPMNPYERRIIHSTLQNDRYVETHSEGQEPYRRVVVTLKKNN